MQLALRGLGAIGKRSPPIHDRRLPRVPPRRRARAGSTGPAQLPGVQQPVAPEGQARFWMPRGASDPQVNQVLDARPIPPSPLVAPVLIRGVRARRSSRWRSTTTRRRVDHPITSPGCYARGTFCKFSGSHGSLARRRDPGGSPRLGAAAREHRRPRPLQPRERVGAPGLLRRDLCAFWPLHGFGCKGARVIPLVRPLQVALRGLGAVRARSPSNRGRRLPRAPPRRRARDGSTGPAWLPDAQQPVGPDGHARFWTGRGASARRSTRCWAHGPSRRRGRSASPDPGRPRHAGLAAPSRAGGPARLQGQRGTKVEATRVTAL